MQTQMVAGNDQGSGDSETHIEFDEFWERYPRKVAKGAARKAWAKLTPDQKQKIAQVIDDHAQHYGTKQLRYVPHPTTWLNQERWDDELPTFDDSIPHLDIPPQTYAQMQADSYMRQRHPENYQNRRVIDIGVIDAGD